MLPKERKDIIVSIDGYLGDNEKLGICHRYHWHRAWMQWWMAYKLLVN
jgi:hypothetical protein